MTNVHLPDSVGKVAGEIYSDTASNTLKEASKIGVDFAKTIRLALAPLQFTAALQDRLARHIDKAIRQVPEENRTTPIESVFLPTAEKLKFQEESNPLTTLYINLLSRSMDKERLGEAHPAFYNIINQLCPDEATFIEQLAEKKHCFFPSIYCSYPSLAKEITSTPDIVNEMFNEALTLIESSLWNDISKATLKQHLFDFTKLYQPKLFSTFLEHLQSLGVIEYLSQSTLEKTNLGIENTLGRSITDDQIYNKGEVSGLSGIQLTSFGNLFHQACCKNIDSKA